MCVTLVSCFSVPYSDFFHSYGRTLSSTIKTAFFYMKSHLNIKRLQMIY